MLKAMLYLIFRCKIINNIYKEICLVIFDFLINVKCVKVGYHCI